MNREELEALRRDVEELKRAVRRNNPFLRQIIASRKLATMSLPFGALFILMNAAVQFFVSRDGGFDAIPEAVRVSFWLLLAAMILVGSVIKWTIFTRNAVNSGIGANYFKIVRTMYGGSWFHINIPVLLAALGGIVFAVAAGRPWFALPAAMIGFSIVWNSIGIVVERREYLVTGWYGLASGLAALFLVEQAPFLWLALAPGVTILLFGIAGSAREPGEEGR